MDRLWAKSQALTGLLTELVRAGLEPAGARLASPADPHRRGGHVSVAHPQAWPCCATLIERGLVVSDFRAPGAVRLGPVPLYTRFVEAYDAVEHVRKVLESGLTETPPDRPRVT
jgi:kynureninase